MISVRHTHKFAVIRKNTNVPIFSKYYETLKLLTKIKEQKHATA